jgi:hypothetical protein
MKESRKGNGENGMCIKKQDESKGPEQHVAFWKTGSYVSWMTCDTASAIGATLRGFAVPLVAFSVSHSLGVTGWLSTFTLILQQVCVFSSGAP